MNQDAFRYRSVPILVPETGTGEKAIRLITWLVPEKSRVIPGERLVELLVEGIVLQVDAEIEGILETRTAQPGDLLSPGEPLGVIRTEDTPT